MCNGAHRCIVTCSGKDGDDMTNSDSNRYAYRPGKAYAFKKADSPADYLATALKAERFIASWQVEDADGISWDVQTWPGQNLSLYSGDAGKPR